MRAAIRDDPNEAATLTSRANLVAVITNGTTVLGLGNIISLLKRHHPLTQYALVCALHKTCSRRGQPNRSSDHAMTTTYDSNQTGLKRASYCRCSWKN